MRPSHVIVAIAAFALTLGGCGTDDAKDPGDSPAAATSSPASPRPTDGPTTFDETDYTYVLTRSCYCPFTAPVRVTVEDGAVTSAVATQRGRSVRKGDDAPASLHLTIADIIEQANDPGVAAVDVDWPDGQAWPSRVSIDQIEGATDDEITYVIASVRIK